MKVLSVHQPWAGLIAVGLKTGETRTWSTSHRGDLAIHATLSKSRDREREFLKTRYGKRLRDRLWPDECSYHGAIICVVTVTGCDPMLPIYPESSRAALCDPYPKAWVWWLENVRAVKPCILAPGRQRIWTLEDKRLDALQSELATGEPRDCSP